MTDAASVVEGIQRLGLGGALVLALIGGFRQWWVFGWTYRSLERERDTWRTIALSSTTLAERATSLTLGKPP